MSTEPIFAEPAAIHAPFVDVPTALEEIRAGRMVVVVDDEDRENEGDLTLAAQFVTPEAINFMARYGRGLICLTLTEDRADFLNLPPMTQMNSSRFGTAFTESIEAREGVTTGISAHDRAHTIRTAIASQSTAADLARPGHVFPLRARRGGVLVRAGQTEASVDLARLAGLEPAGVICEIMNEDGTMARVPDLVPFCRQHDLKMLTVAELIRYRLRHERYIRRVGESELTNRFGRFRLIAYESEINGGESHLALVHGGIDGPESCTASAQPILVRVHTHCTAGDIFGADCRCREMLDASMRAIVDAGCGAIIYLHNTSRGFEWSGRGSDRRMLLHPEMRAQEAHEDRHRRIVRAVGLGGQILSDLGIRRIRILSNTPMHVPALQGFGLEIVEQVPIPLDSGL
jgi:3,4-dihydroxy 2-butanone 4-phosphate synthase/GTP cyclohydrolase II